MKLSVPSLSLSNSRAKKQPVTIFPTNDTKLNPNVIQERNFPSL